MDVERILAATEGIITPVAVVDEEIVERNLTRMAKLAADHNVRLRPHAKTHKSSHMAKRQMAHGAVGLTCATFTEAEVFADAGVDDLLIAHPPVGRPKLERLAALASRVKRLAVSLDDVEVRELSVGSTPTAGLALRSGITEMRPGTYIYGDANQVTLGSQALEDCALAVVATVVATPAVDRAVADAGSKALSAALRVAGLSGHGMVLGHPNLSVARLSEEHTIISATGRTGLTVGDR